MRQGDIGQFDVVVDGEVIATREKSVLKRFLSGGWPEPQAVIDKLRSLA
jgi:hypothetical protein